MKKNIYNKIPILPLFRKNSYIIPETYSLKYDELGINRAEEKRVLFHLTQFGGFRMRKIPRKFASTQFIDEWCVVKKAGKGYSFKSNTNFMERLGDIELRPLEKIWHNKCVNESSMVECGYESEEINKIKKFLGELNKFYSSIRVELKMPQSGIAVKDRIQLANFHSVPFLVAKPLAGGRFFHPETSYQRINSVLRPMLTINGAYTAEIDISAATLQFLNIALENKGNGSIADILDRSDPYNYFSSELNSSCNLNREGWHEVDRDTLKSLIYTLIYSPGESRGRNLNYKLRNIGHSARYMDFVEIFPEFFEALDSLRESEFPVHMLINREESTYARSVLEKGCLVKGFPILPLHDSFIVQHETVGDLENIMDESSRELYGRQLRYKRKF